MPHSLQCYLFVIFHVLVFIMKWPTFCLSSMVESKILNVGEELWRETLPLQLGSRLYHLQGLKPDMWYEVKISYPGSIPASFSLELKRDLTSLVEKQSRKLLDTEKLLFKTEGMNLLGDQVDTHVLVTVKSEGVVAIPSVQERESIIFNIACDELLIGIPHKAWGVGGLVIFCLILAFIIPSLLPSWLLQTNQTQGPGNHHASKSS
ncbi:uncharacterized protein LOC120081684 isoform X1 [Benincasa hispida]|uniref:uncharacterized protein LOC120081684 isoform X1 n=2 Tax=Benincasa hispida TaxID=102211 RepID=UPI0018FF63CA|nr:uncharacterized protein LOC120081684 isoform X1 [Benincasa hispida]XP_038892687.1 uncharacterized protein LOC120081684 isoform X1 [Benincasa hispida]XP_038892688.1 uncharacterized protein LOC120081684 isoform X1 [Benincasa hispida]XP_038892689.1 uncharacterized protein LOC120081684 isoform X1 [Benincasa hispida]